MREILSHIFYTILKPCNKYPSLEMALLILTIQERAAAQAIILMKIVNHTLLKTNNKRL